MRNTISDMTISVSVPKGKYVVAVSGGVDSMVLLDLLVRDKAEHELIVAHYKHNLRSEEEARQDMTIVEDYCNQHDLHLVIGEYSEDVFSETAMREARYLFLNTLLVENNYNAVITAHHKDDLLETAIINILRGTNGAGLHSITNRGGLLRPLLNVRKHQLIDYAEKHKIRWHEDSTNADEAYLRNYVRANIIPKLESKHMIEEMYDIIAKQAEVNDELEALLPLVSDMHYINRDNGIGIGKTQFINLPHAVAKLIIKDMIQRTSSVVELDAVRIEKAVIFAKTAKQGATLDLERSVALSVGDEQIAILVHD